MTVQRHCFNYVGWATISESTV